MRTTRPLLPLVAFLLVAVPAPAEPPTVAPAPHPSLSQLLKDYKRYGLPFPPENAELVKVKWMPGDRPPAYSLSFRIPPAKLGDEPRYLFGGSEQDWDFVDSETVELVDPLRVSMAGIDMPIHHLLRVALQCEARDWHNLAAALYQQALEDTVKDEAKESMDELLRLLALDYWVEQVTKHESDRSLALRQLESIVQNDQSLTPWHQGGLRQLELTVAPRKSKPGSVEALIDDLLDYHVDWEGWSKPNRDEAYWKLVDLGFDAVPALIEHVQDDRFTRTRSIGFGGFGGPPLTVGHLCSQLLSDLSAATISKTGQRLEREHVQKWFTEAWKVGEEKWLIDHAIPKEKRGSISHDEIHTYQHIYRLIRVKYPNRLPEIYRARLHMKSTESLGDLVEQIVASKMPQEEKAAILEAGAKHLNPGHRFFALKGLSQIDSQMFRKHLTVTLRALAAKPVGADSIFWPPDPFDSMTMFALLVTQTDDRECWELMLSATKKLPVNERFGIIWEIGPEKTERGSAVWCRQVHLLQQFLGDGELAYDDEDFKYELRDAASYHLAKQLGVKMRRNPTGALSPHPGRSAIMRLLFREVLRELATRELAKAGK